MFRLLNAVLLLAFLQITVSATSSEPVERLRAHVAVDLITGVPASDIAGHYSSKPKELGRSALSGNDLYLFPDSSYLYLEWADVEPPTIRDKGTWAFSAGTVRLTSDPEVTWDPDAERSYVVVHREARPREALLVGLSRALPYFEEKANGDPNFMLLPVANTRTESIAHKPAARVKAKLMREAWRPEYFRSPQK